MWTIIGFLLLFGVYDHVVLKYLGGREIVLKENVLKCISNGSFSFGWIKMEMKPNIALNQW